MGIDQIMDLVNLKVLIQKIILFKQYFISFSVSVSQVKRNVLLILQERKLERSKSPKLQHSPLPPPQTNEINKSTFWKVLLGFHLRKNKK